MRFVTNKMGIDEEQAIQLLLAPHPYIAVDLETVSLENQLVLGIAIAISREVGYYFFNPRDELVKQVVEQSPLTLFHNASFDVPALKRLGITRFYNWHDTMLLAYSAGILDKGLEALSRDVLGKPYTSITSQWKKPNQGNIAIDHVKMAGWSLQHALNTLALWEVIPKTQLYQEIDRPCVDLVIEMEGWGVKIDQYRLTPVEQETMTKALKLEAELKLDLNSPDINLASNPQVAKALQAMGIMGTRKTKSGADSVGEESLKSLHNPVANRLLKYRSLLKTLTTYVPSFRKPDSNGRIHTVYGYADTGRWTSGDKAQGKPNLQNISRDERFADE